MIGLEGKHIASRRLKYRLLEEGDKPALARLLADPQVTRPAGFMPAGTSGAFDDFFDQLTLYRTAIAVLMDDTLIGYCRVNRYRCDLPELMDKACVSTGFVIGKVFQGQGFGTEMLQTLTAYLLTRFSACFADCFADNAPSRKTIEKCGYRYVESYSLYFEELDAHMDCLSYVHT